jgi:Cu/Ag efflux pump CusA
MCSSPHSFLEKFPSYSSNGVGVRAQKDVTPVTAPKDVGVVLSEGDIEEATIDGAVQRLRPELMTVTAVILSLAPILWESGIGSDVMKPIAAPIVGGVITST